MPPPIMASADIDVGEGDEGDVAVVMLEGGRLWVSFGGGGDRPTSEGEVGGVLDEAALSMACFCLGEGCGRV